MAYFDAASSLGIRATRASSALPQFSSEYVDAGVCGAKERRPQLDALLAACRKRRVDAVVVYRYDRFARSLRQLVNTLEEFRSLGIEFISLHEGVDTSIRMEGLCSPSLRALPSLSGHSRVGAFENHQFVESLRGHTTDKSIGVMQLNVDKVRPPRQANHYPLHRKRKMSFRVLFLHLRRGLALASKKRRPQKKLERKSRTAA
jgi:Resolvase, N terminal domain